MQWQRELGCKAKWGKYWWGNNRQLYELENPVCFYFANPRVLAQSETKLIVFSLGWNEQSSRQQFEASQVKIRPAATCDITLVLTRKIPDYFNIFYTLDWMRWIPRISLTHHTKVMTLTLQVSFFISVLLRLYLAILMTQIHNYMWPQTSSKVNVFTSKWQACAFVFFHKAATH